MTKMPDHISDSSHPEEEAEVSSYCRKHDMEYWCWCDECMQEARRESLNGALRDIGSGKITSDKDIQK